MTKIGQKNIWKISLAICLAITELDPIANAVHVPAMKGCILGHHKKTSTHFLNRGAKVMFMAFWKVLGAPHNPNAITQNS
jgi:hypothetical protein